MSPSRGSTRSTARGAAVAEVAAVVTIGVYVIAIVTVALAGDGPLVLVVGAWLVLIEIALWRSPRSRPVGFVTGLLLCAFAGLGVDAVFAVWPLLVLGALTWATSRRSNRTVPAPHHR